jgi:K+-sensing histidine kinase KdpD
MYAMPSKSLRYFVAIAATAVVFTARFLLQSDLGDVAPLLMFTLSVTVAAWYGGLGPGLLATALGVILGDYFFIEPFYSFRIFGDAEWIEEILFLGICISISLLSQARISLEAKRQQLLASERDARMAAEYANQLKDEFLSTVSHELRTPLTSINGWALMLQSGRLDEPQSARALETIVRSARSQNQLIGDLLDVSRIIAGRCAWTSPRSSSAR